MTNNIFNTSTSPSIPIFKGEKYHLWSIKMQTMFKSQDLWDLVETGYTEPNPRPDVPDAQLKDTRKKDAKALFFIQSALDDDIFPRITGARNAHEAWETLKQEYLGDDRVLKVRLQTLRRDFAELLMGEKESVQSYLSRVTDIVGQMRSYGEKITNEIIVSKVLRSLSDDWNHVVPAIEESKDLSTYTFDELMGSLLAHENRLKRNGTKAEEKAFKVQGESSYEGKTESYSRGRGRGNFRGGRGGCRDHGRGRGHFTGDGGRGRGLTNDFRQQKSQIQCHYCSKYGHKEVDCWIKQKNDQSEANFSENIADESMLFLANSQIRDSVDTNEVWYLDSGCSNHMSGRKNLFKQIDESKRGDVRLGDNKKMQVEGKGTVAIKTAQGDIKLLYDVQFVPDLAHNLLSIGQLMSHGYKIVFDEQTCTVIHKTTDHSIANVRMTVNKMFPLTVSDIVSKALIVKQKNDSDLWHLRYGHLNLRSLKLLSQKDMVIGLPKITDFSFCEGCVYGKQSRASFPNGKAWRASKSLELVHADLCGPMKTESLGGNRYFLLFTDDYSRMSWVNFLKSKYEAFENFKKFKALVENQSGNRIIALRTDRGGEFVSKEFNDFCDQYGIRRDLTTPYTPEQNGVAERKNRTVVEMARSMLKSKGLPNTFWGEAVSTAVYLLNISPTRAVFNRTPFEAWRGKRPGVSHLKVFGCICYALVNNRSKLDEKSEKCIFIGYCPHSKAYRLYNLVSGKIIISRNVVFNEEACSQWNVVKDGTDHCISVAESNGDLETDPAENLTPTNTPPTTPRSNDESQNNSSDDSDSPVRKYKSLAEIYNSCNYALQVSDPMIFEEADEKQAKHDFFRTELGVCNFESRGGVESVTQS